METLEANWMDYFKQERTHRIWGYIFRKTMLKIEPFANANFEVSASLFEDIDSEAIIRMNNIVCNLFVCESKFQDCRGELKGGSVQLSCSSKTSSCVIKKTFALNCYSTQNGFFASLEVNKNGDSNNFIEDCFFANSSNTNQNSVVDVKYGKIRFSDSNITNNRAFCDLICIETTTIASNCKYLSFDSNYLTGHGVVTFLSENHKIEFSNFLGNVQDGSRTGGIIHKTSSGTAELMNLNIIGDFKKSYTVFRDSGTLKWNNCYFEKYVNGGSIEGKSLTTPVNLISKIIPDPIIGGCALRVGTSIQTSRIISFSAFFINADKASIS